MFNLARLACFAFLLLPCSSGNPVQIRTRSPRVDAIAPSASKLQSNGQLAIRRVESMARVPEPLAVRDWTAVSRAYYDRVLDPHASGDSFSAVIISNQDGRSTNSTTAKQAFRMKTYLDGAYDTEAFTCLGAVIGAKLVGLDSRSLHGVNYVERCKAWYDPHTGLYRHRPNDHAGVVHADIYGYWPAIQGMMLAAQYPDDLVLKKQTLTAVSAFHQIAIGMGCPDKPNFDVPGWDFDKKAAGGRPEPMNRLGNAPSVAWPLVVGAYLTGNRDMLICARSTLNWYAAHPGRYEISHMMGPLAAARINVQPGDPVDLGRILDAWFGDGDVATHPWRVTAGTWIGGETCDGLDGARWGDDGFYAFTMGSLQGPAWLAPVARYDQRYARAIARYALNAANSARLLQGIGLDANHQDHATWKARWDPKNLMFYEGLKSWSPDPGRKYQPYATGDPVMNGWNTGHPRISETDYFAQRSAWFGNTCKNISLYMGNHIGFLGGIVRSTDVPGILCWDCVATDWFHPPAYPTMLVYNPFDTAKVASIEPGSRPVDLYDLVQGRVIATNVRRTYKLRMDADSAAELVTIPAGVRLIRKDGRLTSRGIVVDYRATLK